MKCSLRGKIFTNMFHNLGTEMWFWDNHNSDLLFHSQSQKMVILDSQTHMITIKLMLSVQSK